jgi:phosphoglycolate phosphatase-like HAD superfamily hydrolase
MKARCLVFDLDDTLISTSKRQYQVIYDFFTSKGITIEQSYYDYLSYRRLYGCKNIDFFNYANSFSLCTDEFKGFYLNAIEKDTYLDLDELIVDLDELALCKQRHGLKFALLSLRSYPDKAVKQLEKLKLLSMFEKVIFEKHSQFKIPKTLRLMELKQVYNVLLFIGDSKIDFDATIKCDIRFIKVDTCICDFIYEGLSFPDINKFLRQF